MKKSKKGFNDLVYNSLKESKTFSLKSLFESEDSDKKDDDDLFSMGDESSDSEDSGVGGDALSSSDEDTENSELDQKDSPDEEEIELYDTQQSIERLDKILNLRSLTPGDAINSITRENYIKKININKFLISEKDKANDFVSDLKKAVEKNDDLIKTIKRQKSELESGTDISVEKEVEIAIDKLIHFKEKVDIIDLIEELFINKIKLIAPAEDIERNIDDFIELYRDEVHKNRAKIDIPGSKHYNDEEVYLDRGGDYNGAAGARSQG